MILQEIFDTNPTNVNVRRDSNNSYSASADIRGHTIVFQADKYTFYVQPKTSVTDEDQKYFERAWMVEFFDEDGAGHATYRRNNASVEFQTFSFIVNCFKYIIEKHNPAIIVFEADTSESHSRMTLYKRMASKLSNYVMHITSKDVHDYRFILYRKDVWERIVPG